MGNHRNTFLFFKFHKRKQRKWMYYMKEGVEMSSVSNYVKNNLPLPNYLYFMKNKTTYVQEMQERKGNCFLFYLQTQFMSSIITFFLKLQEKSCERFFSFKFISFHKNTHVYAYIHEMCGEGSL